MRKRFNYCSFIVRAFLIRILVRLVDILGKFTYRSHKRPLLIYYGNEKIALSSKNLYHNYKTTPFEEVVKEDDTYNWEKLIEDIKVNGIKDIPIAIRLLKEDNPNIYINNGNHRLKALEVLYGKDYEVVVNLYVPHNYIQYLKAIRKRIKNLMKERLLTIKNKTYTQ